MPEKFVGYIPTSPVAAENAVQAINRDKLSPGQSFLELAYRFAHSSLTIGRDPEHFNKDQKARLKTESSLLANEFAGRFPPCTPDTLPAYLELLQTRSQINSFLDNRLTTDTDLALKSQYHTYLEATTDALKSSISSPRLAHQLRVKYLTDHGIEVPKGAAQVAKAVSAYRRQQSETSHLTIYEIYRRNIEEETRLLSAANLARIRQAYESTDTSPPPPESLTSRLKNFFDNSLLASRFRRFLRRADQWLNDWP